MEINTYIKIPKIKLPDDFLEDPDSFFIHIDDNERMQKYSKQIDDRYLDGALIVSYMNNPILTFELWDDVGDLWACLLNAVEEFLIHGRGECYFPDQPIKIELSEHRNQTIKLMIGEGKYGTFIIPQKDFLRALFDEAEHFA